VAPPRRVATGNIGLLLHTNPAPPNALPSSYLQLMLSGIREGCRERNREVLLIEDETAYTEKTDGIILFCDKLEAYALGIPPEFPHVSLAQNIEGVASVVVDDFNAGKTATSHLIAMGHRRIACLMEELLDDPVQRSAGYRAALLEAGIEADPRWLRQTKNIEFSPSFGYRDWGYQNMRAWLDGDWQQLGCTAIVVQNDHAAIGVMQVLQEAGVDVPGQVSVIGFDGTNICKLTRPHLTSIQMPFHQMGREAVKILCEQIQHGSQTPQNITLPIKLRKGDSVSKLI
jgi:DNA-binding LacI/PurR family transcriptional regulator